MYTALLPLPTDVSPYSSPALPPSKKPLNRKISKPRSSPVMAADNPTGRLRRHPDSTSMDTKIIRNNARKSDSRDLVMEEVRILKRGEAVRPLFPPLSSGDGTKNLMPSLTHRLGPDPKFLPMPSLPAYAGPAFISSPSPSSLPVPLFLKKAASIGEDVATRGIRYLLRLDVSL